MRNALALLAAVAATAAFAGPLDLSVNHELRDGAEVTFAMMFQQNADQNGGGASWPYSFSGAGTFNNPFTQGEEVGKLSMLGLYTLDDGTVVGDGVAIMLDSSELANAVEFEFEDFFPGYTEQQVIDALINVRDANGDQGMLDAGFAVLDPFIGSNWDRFSNNGANANFVGFSLGTNLGTGSWVQQPVPEPGLLLAAGAGIAALAARRRRRSQ